MDWAQGRILFTANYPTDNKAQSKALYIQLFNCQPEAENVYFETKITLSYPHFVFAHKIDFKGPVYG